MLYCGFGHRINNGQGTAVRLYHPGKEGKNLFRGDILIDGREAEVIEARKVVGTQPEAGAVEAVQSLDPPPQGTALHAEKIVRPDAFPEQCLRPAQNSFPHPFRLLTVAGAQQHGAAVGAVKATAEGAVDDAGFVHLQIQLSPTTAVLTLAGAIAFSYIAKVVLEKFIICMKERVNHV